MSRLSNARNAIMGGGRTLWAFLSMEARMSVSYPLGFVMQQLAVLLPLFIYFFVSDLVESTSVLGNDYFSFVVIGLLGLQALNAGMRAFGNQLDLAMNRGWFEFILVEPLRWSMIPLSLASWPIILGLVGSLIIALLALAMGATFDMAGLLPGIGILVMGIVAGLAVGVLSACLKVLAKSGDPLLNLYTFAAQILSGAYFPTENLPAWLKPLSWLLPHTYVISGMRKAMMVNSSEVAGPDIGVSMMGLAVFVFVLMPFALWLFNRALQYGRRIGVLAGY